MDGVAHHNFLRRLARVAVCVAWAACTPPQSTVPTSGSFFDQELFVWTQAGISNNPGPGGFWILDQGGNPGPFIQVDDTYLHPAGFYPQHHLAIIWQQSGLLAWHTDTGTSAVITDDLTGLTVVGDTAGHWLLTAREDPADRTLAVLKVYALADRAVTERHELSIGAPGIPAFSPRFFDDDTALFQSGYWNAIPGREVLRLDLNNGTLTPLWQVPEDVELLTFDFHPPSSTLIACTRPPTGGGGSIAESLCTSRRMPAGEVIASTAGVAFVPPLRPEDDTWRVRGVPVSHADGRNGMWKPWENPLVDWVQAWQGAGILAFTNRHVVLRGVDGVENRIAVDSLEDGTRLWSQDVQDPRTPPFGELRFGFSAAYVAPDGSGVFAQRSVFGSDFGSGLTPSFVTANGEELLQADSANPGPALMGMAADGGLVLRRVATGGNLQDVKTLEPSTMPGAMLLLNPGWLYRY